MRYFIDAEFNGFGGELISLALVPEDEAAPSFYAAITCTNPQPWVAANILPALQIVPLSNAEVAHAFADFLGAANDPVIIADWPEDIAHAALLLVTGPGRMLGVPRLRFELIYIFDFDAAVTSAVPHNALHDARALRARSLEDEAG
ncbi:hypothetical protein GCM10011529_26340 [Polymorphobacter glacialis]|uniref:Uncharacterized protein n=1 Tax=Sandarakinorhabdus glacialis TaxID=1614636 RepID=A0A916ZYA7_9SPHN|nr:hypothetical protein [Polymorphobacter glacialis]GGE18650.1 hypothetical protein GCM10011529_26340 [Polymorphobacter glacialis]